MIKRLAYGDLDRIGDILQKRRLVLPDNVIVVNSINNLPVPVDLSDGLGLAHRLLGGLYEIGDDFVFTNPIAPTALTGQTVYINGLNNKTLEYTGSGAFVRANATNNWASIIFDNVTLKGDGTNTRLDITGTGIEFFSLVFANSENWGSEGQASLQATFWMESSVMSGFGTGITLTDNTINAIITSASQTAAPISGAHFNIAGTSLSTAFTSCQLVPVAGDSAMDIDSGYTGWFDISNSNIVTAFGGIPFKAGSLDQTEPDIIAIATRGIPFSRIRGVASQTVTTTAISIPAADTYVISNVTGWTVDSEERVTISPDGSFVVLAREESKIKIDRDLKIDQTTATAEIGIREWYLPPTKVDVTFTNGTNLINEAGTALLDNDTITFRNTDGTLPAELRDDIIYYVINKLTNSFQVSYTLGGAAVTFTDDGTPTNNYQLATNGSSEPSQGITAGSPQVLSLKAEFAMELDGESVVAVINRDTSNDIRVYTGGYLRL